MIFFAVKFTETEIYFYFLPDKIPKRKIYRVIE